MCKLTDHILLSETDKSRLSRCKCCGLYVMVFNNIYITFNEKEFVSFKWTLQRLSPEDFNKDHPKGAQHVLLKNSRTHIGVSFSRDEVEEVLKLMREAALFEEVFSILYAK